MPKADHRLTTRSPAQTERVGAALATLLEPGTVVALYGDLASGKTCLVRGMASHLTRGQSVSSPTFTIVNQYGDPAALYHLDLYRLDDIEAILDLGVEDLFDGDCVCVIEWAERAGSLLPATRLEVRLAHAGHDARTLDFTDFGTMPCSSWPSLLDAALLNP